jgi:hypothetical protein
MDLARVLSQLHEELDNLDAAIESLESIARGGRRRRGRPPLLLAEKRAGASPKRKAGDRKGRGKKPDEG